MMIADWRQRWKAGDLPFLFAQLANFMARKPAPSESDWAELREAQSMTLSQPRTAMACTIDIGDGASIHPTNKQDVGLRLALGAENLVYGRHGVASGPVYKSSRINGDRMVIRFSSVGSGLKTRDGKPIAGFALAGADRRFYWAEAAADGDDVVVHSDQVAKPVAVRYAWADNPDCNLINGEGLPAVPFRTDDWKGITQRVGLRRVVVDAAIVKGPLNRMFNECVGAGRANEGLRADWQRQLRVVKEQLGFRYIRMHGLLSDDMGVCGYNDSGRVVYNWQYIDELYDFWKVYMYGRSWSWVLCPGRWPAGGRRSSGGGVMSRRQRTMKNGDSSIGALVRHWVERYGADEVAQWYFEVWNEPNLRDGFWTGDEAEYFKLYSVTARAIKAVGPRFRVGGPATAGNAWIPEFIDYCARGGVPVDFVSTHTYGVDVGFLDERGNRGTVLSRNDSAIFGDVRRSRRQIDVSALPGLELHYTEWSSSYTPSDPLHDNYQEAAYVLDKLRKTGGAANSMSYWTFTDIFEEAGPRMTPFHGGFGLVNYEDIAKPAYYSYKYLNRLGGTELSVNDEASWACKDQRGIYSCCSGILQITARPETV
ncbi:GH39 family glycosyl hydrolase [Puia sp. P3]|uniref:GH39 family glycosyl hydrolase n=1 Tax=Puia sp. P3 TaxID=3423952 RepID=UPI003D67FA82